MKRTALGVTTMLLVGLYCATAAPAAEADNPGKRLYLKYCSACHGSGGKGDGVVSGFLRPRPTDLTKIAKVAKNGEFPLMEVAQAIDGSKRVGAHGEGDMPVWGEIFREESTSPHARQAEVRAKIMLIAEYLRTLQEK